MVAGSRSGRPEFVLSVAIRRRTARSAGNRGFCQYQSGIQRDFGLAAIALADDRPMPPPHGAGDKDAKDKAKETKEPPKEEEPKSPRTSCPRSSSARRSRKS